jgi:peptidyl-tRNA hydrolase|tara:strand:- start:1248 stop:1460 length:213 start_codon:yes stop_codon:yes gene_type:complete
MFDFLFRFLGYKLDKDIVREYVLKKIAEEEMQKLEESKIVNNPSDIIREVKKSKSKKRRQRLKKQLAYEL